MAADDLLIRIDVDSSRALEATNAYGAAVQKLDANVARASKAQATYDAAVAKSGASSNEARIAQERLGASMARMTVAAQKAAVAEARAAEVQTAAASKIVAAEDKAALASSKAAQAQGRASATKAEALLKEVAAYEAATAKETAAADKAAAAQTAATAKLTAARKASAASAVQSLTGFSVQTTGALALGAAFVYAAKSAADFDAKLATLKALDPSANIAALREAAMGYADIGVSASEAADAQIELTKAGISAKDIMGGALTGALTLASAGQMEVADATEIAAAAMTAFQLAGKDIPHVADLLAAGADKALGSVQDLGYGLKYAALPAHQLGVSVEETVGTLSEFAQAGLIGSQGGTALAMMLQRLIKPTDAASAVMQRYGIHLYDAQGAFVGMSDLAGQLHDKLGGLTLATRESALSTIFSARAARGAAILYQDGADGVQEWTERVNEAGFAAQQSHDKLDSLSGDLTKLKAAFENLATKQGEGAQSPLRSLTQELTNLLGVVDGVSSMPGWGIISKFLGPTSVMSPVGWGQRGLQLGERIFGGDDPTPQVINLWGALKNVQDLVAGSVSGAMTKAGNASRAMGGAMGDTADSVSTYRQVVDAAKAATDGLGFSVKQLTNALKSDQDVLSHRAALRDYASAIKAANDQQDKAKTTTQQMNATLDSQASAALNVASTMKGSQGQIVGYLNKARDSLYQQARQFGMTRDEADKYVNSVLHIPGEANTHVNLYAEEAQRRINALLSAYNQLRDKTFTVTESIRTVGGFTAGGHTVYGNADGGEIRGPGTGTSDSILRALSNGEFVVKTKSAQAIGYDNLHSMNRTGRIPAGMAAGGTVRSIGGGAMSGGSRTVYMSDPALVAEVRALRERMDGPLKVEEQHPEKAGAAARSQARVVVQDYRSFDQTQEQGLG